MGRGRAEGRAAQEPRARRSASNQLNDVLPRTGISIRGIAQERDGLRVSGAPRSGALAVAKDGSLLVADDTGGTIWRISYKGTAEHAATPGTGASAAKSRAAGR